MSKDSLSQDADSLRTRGSSSVESLFPSLFSTMSLDPHSQPIYAVKRHDPAYDRSPYRTTSPATTEPGAISRSPEDAYYGAQGLASSPPRVTIPSWGPPLSSTLVDPRQQHQQQQMLSPGSTPSSRTTVGRSRSTAGVQTELGGRVAYSPPSTASTISTSSLSSSGHSISRRPTIPSPTINKPAPLEWENVFHPSFLPNIPDFASEWSFTGLYTSHILFTQWGKPPPYKKLLIYNIQTQTADQPKFKYDTCGLGPGGVYLLYRHDHEMHLYDVANKATIKSASLRNLTRWSYNAQGFCILDEAGNFWRWSFNDRLPPSLLFRLANRAPRARLRCLTTRDGAWNAIVAVSRERTGGLVHCYPTDNDESKIFPGVLAAFIQTEIDNVKVTHIAVVEIISEDEGSSERTLVFTINQLGASVSGAIRRVETRMPYEAVGGPPSAMFIDNEQAIAVVLITPPKDNYVALLFDLRAGTFIMKQTITKYEEDNWLVDDTGIFRERSGCIVQRLNIRADGLPPRMAPQPRGGLPPLSPLSPGGLSPRYGPTSPNSPQMPPRKSSLPVMANDVLY